MSSPEQETNRGAAEEESGVPVTPTEVETSEHPPSQPDSNAGYDVDAVAGDTDAVRPE